MTPCKQCQTASINPLCGVYNFACAPCCARLVATTRPDKAKASAMLAAIARFKTSPHRSVIVGLLTAPTSAPPSAMKSCGTASEPESSPQLF